MNISVPPDVLEANFDALVDEYLGELNARLKKLNCSSTYERADFGEDFIKLKFFSIQSFFILCCLTSPLDVQQLVDYFNQSEMDFNRMQYAQFMLERRIICTPYFYVVG